MSFFQKCSLFKGYAWFDAVYHIFQLNCNPVDEDVSLSPPCVCMYELVFPLPLCVCTIVMNETSGL